MDFQFKNNTSDVKLSGLDSGLDLDADKVGLEKPVPSFQQQLEIEEMKRRLRNQPFDPNHMEINVAEPTVDYNTANPADITFDFN